MSEMRYVTSRTGMTHAIRAGDPTVEGRFRMWCGIVSVFSADRIGTVRPVVLCPNCASELAVYERARVELAYARAVLTGVSA